LEACQRRHAREQYPPFPPTLKALLHRLHGLPRWSVRPPLVEVPEEVKEQAAAQMRVVA